MGLVRLSVWTVAAFHCFFIRFFGASEQKPNMEYFRFYDGLQAINISGN